MSPVKEKTIFTCPTVMKSIFVVVVISLVGTSESRPSPEAPPANYMGTLYDSVPPYTSSIFTYNHKDSYAAPPRPTAHYENLYEPPQHHSSRPQDRHSSDYSRHPPKQVKKGYSSYTTVEDTPTGSYSPFTSGYQPESWYNTMKGGYDDYGYTGYSVPKKVPSSSSSSSGPQHYHSSDDEEEERRHPSGSTPDEDEPSSSYESNNEGGSSSSAPGDDEPYSSLGHYEEDDIGGPPVYSAYGKGSRRRPHHSPKSRPYSSHHKESHSYRLRPTYGPPKLYQHKVKTYASYGPPPSVSYGSSRRPSYGPPHHLVIKGKKKRNSLPKRRPRPSHHQREKVVDDDFEESLYGDDFKWKNERRQNKERRNNKSRSKTSSKSNKDRTKDKESQDEKKQSSSESSPLPRLSAIWSKIVSAISEEV